MGLLRLTVFFATFIMIFSVASSAAQAADKKPTPIYIIERDTLQTRNYTPVINHQTLIVNMGKIPVVLEVSSAIPPGKYIRGDGYPAFLDESLLPDPLFSPFDIAPKKTTYLARPDIVTKKDQTVFIWKKMSLPSGEALVAQYDNFFGADDYYWREDGFDFLGLEVKADYDVRPLSDNIVAMTLDYQIINKTGQDLKDLSIGVFVPVTQIMKDGETPLLKLERICTSPNAEASRITKSDGFGEAAFGVGIGFTLKAFSAGGQERFSLGLSGTPLAKSGALWPIMTVTGRNLKSSAWPATTVKANAPVHEGRFSYLSYNLVIKDRLTFKLDSGTIKIVKAK
jgi:hypothetical protein